MPVDFVGGGWMVRRRQRLVAFSADSWLELILEMQMRDRVITLSGLPPDARLVRAYTCPEYDPAHLHSGLAADRAPEGRPAPPSHAPEGVLRGIILREDGQDLVVRAPSAAEVQAFGAGGEVHLKRPAGVLARVPLSHLAGETLYDRLGHAVCVVDQVEVGFEALDVTTFADDHTRFRPGRRTFTVRGQGIPE